MLFNYLKDVQFSETILFYADVSRKPSNRLMLYEPVNNDCWRPNSPALVLDLFFVLTSSVTYDERFACLVGSRSDVNTCVIMYQ